MTYVCWWTWRLLTFIKTYGGSDISVQFLSESTGILQSDIIYLFESFKILRYHQGDYYFAINDDMIEQLLKLAGSPGYEVKPENIHWSGYQWYVHN